MYDIIDSQLHLFQGIEPDACLAVMDALGVQGILIDESWGYNPAGQAQPFTRLPGGFLRPTPLGARIATMKHPERFRYLVRVDHRDPDLATAMKMAAQDEYCVAFRAMCYPVDMAELRNGAYTPIFRAAAEVGRPVFVQTIGESTALEPFIAEITDCEFVIDHVGLVKTAAQWEALLRLGHYPNLSLKWCHANLAFPSNDYPFPPMQAALRQAVDGFGQEHVLWASDATMARAEFRWAEILFYVRECDLLSVEEREWVLGRSARRLLNWSAPADMTRVNPNLGAVVRKHQHNEE